MGEHVSVVEERREDGIIYNRHDEARQGIARKGGNESIPHRASPYPVEILVRGYRERTGPDESTKVDSCEIYTDVPST